MGVNPPLLLEIIMLKITPHNTENIHILVGNNAECINLANIALANRLYVSGWEMSHTLQRIKRNHKSSTIAILFQDNTPIAISLQENCARIQVFTRKEKRKNGYGKMVMEAVMKNRMISDFYTQYGVNGSDIFFSKVRTNNIRDYNEKYTEITE